MKTRKTITDDERIWEAVRKQDEYIPCTLAEKEMGKMKSATGRKKWGCFGAFAGTAIGMIAFSILGETMFKDEYGGSLGMLGPYVGGPIGIIVGLWMASRRKSKETTPQAEEDSGKSEKEE